MKIWNQYGSEHSANIVMIGNFKDAAEASQAQEAIEALTEQVENERKDGMRVPGNSSERYGREMLDLLSRLGISSIGPQELEQFLYEFDLNVEGNSMVLTTEETEISAFLKVMIDRGARVEVYSAHDYPDTKHGRGR